MVNKVKIYNSIFLFDANKENVLLLKRSPKEGTPGLDNKLTGIGGKVELDKGEASDLKKSVFRELEEETHIKAEHVTSISCPIFTSQLIEWQPEASAIIYWYTGILHDNPKDLWCSEGVLGWYSVKDLKKYAREDKMTDTATYVLPWIIDKLAFVSKETAIGVNDNQMNKSSFWIMGDGFYNPFEDKNLD